MTLRHCVQLHELPICLEKARMSYPVGTTPQERLAISRKAIVRHMNRHHPEAQENLTIKGEDGGESRAGKSVESNRFSQIKHLARVWWHRHPASAIADLASPFIDNYAKAHPFKLLGASAVAGAALVIIRPWRMVSASALLIAAVKSSGLSNTLLTMLSAMAHDPDITGDVP